MRAILGVLSLLIALAIVGVLAKKQMAGMTGSAPSSTEVSLPVTRPNATPQEQSQQMQQQVKQSVEAAMQQARPMPDDK